jgi:hypothetical protein
MSSWTPYYEWRLLRIHAQFPKGGCRIYTGCPKKMETRKVNIPYYNVYTSFWDNLYIYTHTHTHTNTNGVCFTLEVTEYFIHHLCEADWLTRARDSRCAEVSNTQPPSFVTVTLSTTDKQYLRISYAKHSPKCQLEL